MKRTLTIFAVAILLVVAPRPCFAVWDIETVTRERAKELGMKVSSSMAGPRHVTVDLEIPAKGELQHFSRVDLRIGPQDNPTVIVPLREDRSKPECVVVSFTADGAQLDRMSLWVRVPGSLGGSIHALRVKDFVELKKAP